MLNSGLPVLYAILIWWASTGLVLYLVWQQSRGQSQSMALLSLLMPTALWSISQSSAVATPASAYAAFTAALAVWAWHEMSFLTGLVTGPETSACEKDVAARAPFGAAAATVIYHEVAILLTLAVIAALTWGGPNQTAVATFAVLAILRLSTKINIYLGVPNITDGFLPERVGHLRSYFCRRAMNGFFPLSATMATAAALWFGQLAISADASPFEATSAALIATFIGLGLLEHWFLVLPLPSASLWSWIIDVGAKRRGGSVTTSRGLFRNIPVNPGEIWTQPEPAVVPVPKHRVAATPL